MKTVLNNMKHVLFILLCVAVSLFTGFFLAERLADLWAPQTSSLPPVSDLEPRDSIWYQAQYPSAIMQFQDWHYVLDEPGGEITKLENISSGFAPSKQ
jgi:hypothetical protein